jgi:hypothetical protein
LGLSFSGFSLRLWSVIEYFIMSIISTLRLARSHFSNLRLMFVLLSLACITLSRSPALFLLSSHKVRYSLSKNRRKVLNVSLLPLSRTNHGIQTCLSSSSTSFQNATLLLRMSLSIRFPPLAEITHAST